MNKSKLFNVSVFLLLILASSMLSFMVLDHSDNDLWVLSGVITTPNYDYPFDTKVYGNMFQGEDGTLYTVDGRNINAIDRNGSIGWTLDIPDVYKMYKDDWTYDATLIGPSEKWTGIDAVTHDDNLYILLKPENPYPVNTVLLAVDTQGKPLWDLVYTRQLLINTGQIYEKRALRNGYGSPDAIFIDNNTLYTYSDSDRFTAIGLNGSILSLPFNEHAGRPSFDENGIMYTKGVIRPDGPYSWDSVQSNDNRTIEAYYPNGTLKWQRTFKELSINMYYMPVTMGVVSPTYRNGTIFVWSNDGIIALDRDGNVKWEQRMNGLYLDGCGFDQNGTIYLCFTEETDGIPGYNSSAVMVISPDGHVIAEHHGDPMQYNMYGLHYLPDGILYSCKRTVPAGSMTPDQAHQYYKTFFDSLILESLKENNGTRIFPQELRDLYTADVSGCDLMSGEALWNNRIPLDRRTVTLSRENARNITFNEPAITRYYNNVDSETWYENTGIPPGHTAIRNELRCDFIACNDTIYVNMWSYNYEVPAFYGTSKCVYSGGIYAFDKIGNMIWSRPTNTRVVSMHEDNGILYYGTADGMVHATAIRGIH